MHTGKAEEDYWGPGKATVVLLSIHYHNFQFVMTFSRG